MVKTFAEQKETAWEDEDYIKEMKKRFKEYESGKVQGYSLEETESRARQAYKAKREK